MTPSTVMDSGWNLGSGLLREVTANPQMKPYQIPQELQGEFVCLDTLASTFAVVWKGRSGVPLPSAPPRHPAPPPGFL